jgi:hypothetical protein
LLSYAFAADGGSEACQIHANRFEQGLVQVFEDDLTRRTGHAELLPSKIFECVMVTGENNFRARQICEPRPAATRFFNDPTLSGEGHG